MPWRETFVVRVDEDGTTLVEDVRTRRAVRVDGPAAVGPEIERRLAEAAASPGRDRTHEPPGGPR